MSFRAYIHDKIAIFLNLVLVLLAIFNVLLVLLKVDTSRSSAIIANNTLLGLAGFDKTAVSGLYQFAIIPVVIVAIQSFLAWRLHSTKRQLALMTLGFGIIAVIFSIVVSGAILEVNR
jgi:hypothetical protein